MSLLIRRAANVDHESQIHDIIAAKEKEMVANVIHGLQFYDIMNDAKGKQVFFGGLLQVFGGNKKDDRLRGNAAVVDTAHSGTELIEVSQLEQLEQIGNKFSFLMACYRCAIMEVETKIRVLNETLSQQYDRNPIETIKTRLKNPRSIADKLRRKGLAQTVANIEENLNDVAGIRVICSFPEDVYLIARYLLQQDDVELVSSKDYIRHPKANGYRSLHLIIETPIFLADEKKMMRVEVQLRTIAMDFWASLEHKLRYKKDLDCAEEIAAELMECAEESARLDARMQHIRARIEYNE